jgi:hypothetical protein
MKRLLLLTCALFSLGASAQAFAFRLPSDTTSTSYTYGAAKCSDTITMSWNYVLQVSGTPNDSLQIWATTTSSCADTPGTNDVVLTTVTWPLVASTRQGSFTVKLSSLPSFTADGGTTTCPTPSPASLTSNLCGVMPYLYSSGLGGSTQYAKAVAFPMIYDTLPPGVPAIVTTVAQDSSVSVGFTADSDTTTVTVEVMGPADPDFKEVGSATVANTSTVRGTGLTNNLVYQVRIRAIDAAGNVSNPSATVSVTPIDTIGFFGYYAEQGGDLNGGCATAPGLMTLLLAAFALRHRRMKR